MQNLFSVLQIEDDEREPVPVDTEPLLKLLSISRYDLNISVEEKPLQTTNRENPIEEPKIPSVTQCLPKKKDFPQLTKHSKDTSKSLAYKIISKTLKTGDIIKELPIDQKKSSESQKETTKKHAWKRYQQTRIKFDKEFLKSGSDIKVPFSFRNKPEEFFASMSCKTPGESRLAVCAYSYLTARKNLQVFLIQEYQEKYDSFSARLVQMLYMFSEIPSTSHIAVVDEILASIGTKVNPMTKAELDGYLTEYESLECIWNESPVLYQNCQYEEFSAKDKKIFSNRYSVICNFKKFIRMIEN